jgi:diguanylate cyclase (GGDEF)-like protein
MVSRPNIASALADEPLPWYRLFDLLLLGQERLMRVRLVNTLLAIVVLLCASGLARFAVVTGLARPQLPHYLLQAVVPFGLVVYVLIRTGWSERLQDPAMVMLQSCFALCTVTLAYAMVDPQGRGAALIFVATIVVFGMYTLTSRQALFIGFFAAGLLGSVIAVMSRVDPGYFPWREELVRFELLAATLPALTFTSRHIAAWREHLVREKRELNIALAKVQELATRDTLTGLVNRRHMQEMLEQEWHRQDRTREPFTVAMIDLDHFKRVNDQFGHSTGDEVLRNFARTAEEVLRNTDVIARWGGEEFLILFTNTTPTQAQPCLQRLSDRLAERQVPTLVPALRISFSAGIAQHHRGRPLEQTLERADSALYSAKMAGRNRSQAARITTIPSDYVSTG